MNAHWILLLRKPISKEEYNGAWYRCSNCNCAPLDCNKDYPIYESYCHCCGAHMIEEPVVKIEEYNDSTAYNWE